jgi:hypothetical protein
VICFFYSALCSNLVESDESSFLPEDSTSSVDNAIPPPTSKSPFQGISETTAGSSCEQLIGQLKVIRQKIEYYHSALLKVRIAIGISSLGLLSSGLLAFVIFRIDMFDAQKKKEMLSAFDQSSIENSCLVN